MAVRKLTEEERRAARLRAELRRGPSSMRPGGLAEVYVARALAGLPYVRLK